MELDLQNELLDDTTELCTLLENEGVEKSHWVTIALAYAKQKKVDLAFDIITAALGALSRGKAEDRLSLLACQCWLYLWKCREAPRLRPEGQPDAKTKDFYLQAATATINDASRISPSYPPLFLARGVLNLLRASLQPAKSGTGSQESMRIDTLRQAAKCFDDALRTSGGKNIMAVMGKARALFALGKYVDALVSYQAALERAPDVIEPDPRIGIGCCFWQLGHKEHAKAAWERAQELTPDSRIANILMGVYFLDASSQYLPNEPEFKAMYGKAMAYTQASFKKDGNFAMSNSTLGGYFAMKRSWPNVEKLARRAIERTDINAVASDGWYLLARKEHFEGDMARANEYYGKADQARGGDDKGYLPAKFGAAQLKTLMQDFDGAKFRLEKIVSQSKSVEAMTLLGILYAEDVFANQAAGSKEDKSTEQKKAIFFFETVRNAWKDNKKKKVSQDSSVLMNLARLYEADQPEKSLHCLLQVEQMEIDAIDEEDRPEEIDDEAEMKVALREFLPPQLLNNIGCFYYQGERYSQAKEYFQSALTACTKASERDPSLDGDSLVTSISFNLARTYEAESLPDQAKGVYEGLLSRHPDYVDASTRLSYLALRQSPSDGAEAIKQLYELDPSNLEVRSMYGWYISRAKKRTLNIAEDQEQRHYKHTLQDYDKHDRYSLTGMGNLYLAVAREMRRDTDQEKDKRSKQYQKAVEFFDKALQLDPRNAYAAQGIGIAMVEEKKDFSTAIQIFTKIRETLKDASVFINLGHVFCEVKQYTRAIENYEAALTKDRNHDPQILACLGRVWLLKGKQEKNIQAMKTALEYSLRALEAAPDQIHFKFNVAFVQIQLAQLIYGLPEAARTLAEVEAASKGLDEAIDSFTAIAKSPNPPFPRNDIEQRANMGRNTMKRQLEKAMASQREYETKNASRIEEARKAREGAQRKREEEKRIQMEKAEEQRRKIAEERQRMMEEDREMAQRRMEEDKAREEAEYTTDEETGGRKKREKKPKEKRQKRKKKGDETDTGDEGLAGDTDADGTGKSQQRSAATSATPASGSDAERPKKKKRRKLERKSAAKPSKFKSAEMVHESDSDDEAVAAQNANEGLATKMRRAEAEGDSEAPADESMADGGDEEEAATRPARKKAARVLDDDEDEDEEEAPAPDPLAVSGNGDSSMVEDADMAAADDDAADS